MLSIANQHRLLRMEKEIEELKRAVETLTATLALVDEAPAKKRGRPRKEPEQLGSAA